MPTIVYDTVTAQLLGNKAFDMAVLTSFPGAEWLFYLKNKCEQEKWGIATADIVLANPGNFSPPLYLLSDMVTSRTKLLRNIRVKFSVLFSGESPNVAWSFYFNLKKHTLLFTHSVLFDGTRKRVSLKTQFHPLFWPNILQSRIEKDECWQNREFLVMVCANKARYHVRRHISFLWFRKTFKRFFWKCLQIYPFFRFKDLYEERLKAIVYFANNPGFHLYGHGWQNKLELPQKVWKAVRKINPISIVNKIETIKKYKFAMCYENCRFNGYITEKIFDCFKAGCIPIYYGAPNIDQYIPTEAFIDASKFNNLSDMEQYLKSLSVKGLKEFVEAGQVFMHSEKANCYTAQVFADNVFKLINETSKS